MGFLQGLQTRKNSFFISPPARARTRIPPPDSFLDHTTNAQDFPDEYFYNASSETLYFFYNATPGTPPPSSGLVATSVKGFFNVTGTQEDPVVGVTLSGLGFRDTAITFMDPHGAFHCLLVFFFFSRAPLPCLVPSIQASN